MTTGQVEGENLRLTLQVQDFAGPVRNQEELVTSTRLILTYGDLVTAESLVWVQDKVEEGG